ncbi:MAG TPA: universal stress protein [Mycobacteriales bacterium]|nr:universal stress protein [Mycobacteriales bacterium]
MALPTQFELGTDGARTIVAGVDGSEQSLRAASFAAGWARRDGSALVCVYVQRWHAAASQDPHAAMICEQGEREVVAKLRRDLLDAQTRWGVRAELVVRRGDPTSELAKVADEVRADSVVVGRSTKVGHERLGSTGGKLIRAGRWPVTVVP